MCVKAARLYNQQTTTYTLASRECRASMLTSQVRQPVFSLRGQNIYCSQTWLGAVSKTSKNGCLTLTCVRRSCYAHGDKPFGQAALAWC